MRIAFLKPNVVFIVFTSRKSLKYILLDQFWLPLLSWDQYKLGMFLQISVLKEFPSHSKKYSPACFNIALHTFCTPPFNSSPSHNFWVFYLLLSWALLSLCTIQFWRFGGLAYHTVTTLYSDYYYWYCYCILSLYYLVYSTIIPRYYYNYTLVSTIH